MRRILLALVTVALVVSPLAAAEAAPKRYKVTAGVDKVRIDVSSNHQGTIGGSVKVSGRVTGGKVKGKKVRITAINTDHGRRTRDMGWVKLGSKGTYAKRFYPPRGGRWHFRVVMPRSGSVRAGERRTFVDAFHWAMFQEFLPGGTYDEAGSAGLVKGPELTREEQLTGSRFGRFGGFVVRGGGTATFDLSGYRCKKFQFTAGVADQSPQSEGTFRVRQGGRVLIDWTPMRRGERHEPVKSVRDLLLPEGGPFHFDVASATGDDPRDVFFILGKPRAFCTFPSTNLK